MRKYIVFICAICLGLAFATPALSQSKKQLKAKKLFDKGVAALEEHGYKDALEAFEKAYHTSPHWMVLAHIGTCYSKLNRPVESIWALEKYLKDGGEDIDAEEKASARRLLETQRKKVGVLNLSVKEKGAKGTIDGESIGESPFDRTLLKAGPHHIMIILEDGIEEEEIDIRAGQEMTLEFPTEKKPGSAVVATPIPKPEPEDPDEEIEPQPEEVDEELEPEDFVFDEELIEEEPIEEYEEDTYANGVSIPFYVAIGVAAAGLITGGVGFGVYGYYSNSEQNYQSEVNKEQYAGLSWNETCATGRVSDEEELYYCKTESVRRDYEEKMPAPLISGIVGAGVFAVAGGAAVLFYFYPEWFGAGDENDDSASLMILPMAGPRHTGLSLTTTF
jgi:hypothetical protein